MLLSISANVFAVVRRGTDVPESFGITEAEFLTQGPPVFHEEVFHVLKVSGVVIVAEQW
jgi:hypothetical protein